MFSSKSKDTAAVPQPVAPQAPSNGPKRARALSAPSIISADMVINGTLNSTGDIQIDGRIEGDVRSVGLVIGECPGDDQQLRGDVQRLWHQQTSGGRSKRMGVKPTSGGAHRKSPLGLRRTSVVGTMT
jgi:hypothetical protein